MTRLEEATNKCFEITAAFEGFGYSYLAGNFDGQGISFGYLQWCMGQGSLQPILMKMFETSPDNFHRACSVYVPLYKKPIDLTEKLLAACDMAPNQAVEYMVTKQDRMNRLYPHWTEAFKNLGADPVFQNVQRRACSNLVNRALQYCNDFGLKSEQALALFFDTCVQQNTIRPPTRSRIIDLFQENMVDSQLEIVAETVAKQAKDGWQRDILARRMCIARMGGIVGGKSYNLAVDFKLTTNEII